MEDAAVAGERPDGERQPRPSFHIPVLAMAIGAFGTSVLFDLKSQPSGFQFVYAQGAWTLVGLGVLAAVVGITLLVADIVGIDAASPSRRRALLAMGLFDLTVAWFGFTYLNRRSTSQIPVGLTMLAISGLVVLAGLVGLVLEVRRTARTAP